MADRDADDDGAEATVPWHNRTSTVVGASVLGLIGIGILVLVISFVARQFSEPEQAPLNYVDPTYSATAPEAPTTTTTQTITSTSPPQTTEFTETTTPTTPTTTDTTTTTTTDTTVEEDDENDEDDETTTRRRPRRNVTRTIDPFP